MTGPPLPRPTPQSNEIGFFTLGVSPIGTISPFDVWSTIISQYANSPILDGILVSFNAAMDPEVDLDNFFDLMWNVLSAKGYGLDVWGRIVGVSRVLQLQVGNYFCFAEAAQPQGFGFNQGAPFYVGAGLTNSFSLGDDDYRNLILAKAYANICDGSTKAINNLLLTLFLGLGDSWVTDNHDMTMTYTTSWVPTLVQLAIIENSGVLPRSTGVKILYNIP